MFPGKITNAPHVSRARAFLDARAMVRNPVQVIERYRARLGPTFTFHFGGVKRAMVSTSPSLIEHVLKRNSDNYHMSHIRVERMAEFQGRGLLNSHGEAWLRQRRFLSQGFRRSRLSALLPLQAELVDDSLAHLDLLAGRGAVDVYRAMVGITFRLVGMALFGKRMKAAEIEELGSAIARIQGFMVRQIVQPYMIPWFRLSGTSRRYQRVRVQGDRIARGYIEERRRSGQKGTGDLLEILLDTPFQDTGETMTDEQILIECMQLLVAGNETSPTALSWTLYLLGRHPYHIPLIRDEVEAVFGGGPITLAGLHELKLTLRVLQEGMRLYPPFWMIDRVALADDEADGTHIPAGLIVLPFIFGAHRNPEVWKDPEVFDPGRFEDGPTRARHPFAYLPFGGGPRTCIGSNVAMMQMLLVLAAFVRRYDFQLANGAAVDVDPMMILHPRGAIEMRVRRI